MTGFIVVELRPAQGWFLPITHSQHLPQTIHDTQYMFLCHINIQRAIYFGAQNRLHGVVVQLKSFEALKIKSQFEHNLMVGPP